MKNLLKGTSICLLFALAAFIGGNNGDGTWQLLKTTNKIKSRNECGLVAINGKLYLVGGGPNEPAEVFDPAANSWATKAVAPVTMHHLQAVGLNNKVYVLEAFATENYPDQQPMANVYSYDTQKDIWEKGGEMPLARRRAGAGAAAYNGKLYLVAGIQHGHRSGTTNMFDCYDPETRQWFALPNAPHVRDHAQAVVIGDKLYALGGRNTSYHEPDNFFAFFGKTVLEVDCYDFKTGKWTTPAAKLPLGTGGGTAVNFNGRLYYIGGERATATTPNGPQKETYYLDVAAKGSWIQTANLNIARNGTAAAVLNNKIYLAAGAAGTTPGPPPAVKQPNAPPPQAPPPGGGDIALEVFTLN